MLSQEKDDTDTLAAVREGIKVGYTSFHIYCRTGGRIDHTMANLQVLAFLSANNMRGFLYELNNETLTNTFPIGVSNEFINRESSISVSDGTLFVVFPKEAKDRIIQ